MKHFQIHLYKIFFDIIWEVLDSTLHLKYKYFVLQKLIFTQKMIINSIENAAQGNISTCRKNATYILKANDIFENLNLTDVCSQVCRM